MAKVLKIAGVVVAVGALTVVTAGAALGLAAGASLTGAIGAGVAAVGGIVGVSFGTLLTVGAILSTAGSLLSAKPKAPTVSSANESRLTASIELRTPRKMIFGTTAMATDVRDQEWSGDQSVLHRFIVCASHRVGSIDTIWFDDQVAWTAAGGVSAAYAGYLTVIPVLEGSAANAINIGPRMGSSRRYTGCAYVYLRYKLTGNTKKTESPFASTVPSRVTIVGNGAFVYDPRLDSTVPGGSGPQRAADQSTWTWSASAGRNPAIALLWYLLGWRIQNPTTGAMKLAVGKGIPAARLDLQSFITAANLCDETVARADGTTEPRYRCDGIFSEGDAPSLVLDNLKAAMNAVLDDVDGRIRVTVLSNDLAAPIGDLTTGDVLGQFNWIQTTPLTDSVNIIRGGYTDPSAASLYQLVDYPEIALPSRDGIDRIQTVDYALVQSPSQAQRLTKQRLQRNLYGGTFTAVFQATAWKFQKGDVIRFTFRPLGFDRKLFRIADLAVQVNGQVPMMLREEHPDIYRWDATDAPAVVGAAPTKYDPTLSPIIQGIVDAQTIATAAQALAFGKNTIFYRPTAPSAGESVENDRWVDTSSGNVEYRRGAGSGVLAVAGSAVVFPTAGRIVVAPWLPASDARIDANRAALEQTQARLAAILSDGILSVDEKRQFAREWQAAQTSYAALDAKAASFGNVAQLRAALTTAYTALSTAIAAIAPAYNDFAVDSPVDRVTVETRWANFYTAFAGLDVAVTAQTIVVQWSINGTDGWHPDFFGADLYQRQSVDGGLTFGAAVRVVGEDGAPGAPGSPGAVGANGQRTSFVFQRAAAQPATPTAATTPPPGWSDAPPVPVDPPLPLWQTSADFRDAAKLTAWAAPIKLTAASLADLDPVAAGLLAGKGRIFRQASAPLGSISQPNDLWFDASAGDAAYSRGAGSGVLAVGGSAIVFPGAGRLIVSPWLPVSNPQAVKAAVDAASALAVARDAAADSVLTPSEKADLAQQRAQIVAERDGLVAKATAQNLPSTAYQAAYTALIALLDTLALADRTNNTGVDPTTLNDRLTAYYTARTLLVSATGDLTAANQTTVQVTPSFTIDADYQGTVTSGLPLTIVPKVTRGGADIRTANGASYAILATNCTATVDNAAGSATKGLITVTASAANTATVDLTVTVDGLAQPVIRVTIAKRRGDAPASGGASSKTASTDTFTPIASNSFAAISNVLTIGLAAGERLIASAALDYMISGTTPATRTASAKWQYRTAGSSAWSDFATAIEGTTARAGTEPDPGHGDYNQIRTGLSAATYEVQLVAMLSAANRTVSFSGAALIEAKP